MTSDTAAPSKKPTAYLVQLFGDVDLARSSELQALCDAFVDSGALDATVDLEHVTFLDSTGLTFLAKLRNVSITRGAV